MSRPEHEPQPLKERHLRHLRPEITRDLLPLATRLTGRAPLIRRFEHLPHDVNGLLVTPASPREPYEIHFARGQERYLDHIIAHEVGHIVRLHRVALEERLGLAVTDESRQRIIEDIAADVGQLVAAGFPEALLPDLFDEWVGNLGDQLYAFPADLRIESWIHQRYPGLRPVQQRSLVADVQRSFPLLSPAVREVTPRRIYEATMALNAAQAWHVAMLFDRPDLLTPFQHYSLAIPGRNLARTVLDASDDGHRSDMAATEEWAKELGVTGWFEWVAKAGST